VQTDPDATLDLATLKGLAQFEERLEALPEVQGVSSITTVFQLVNNLLGAAPDRGLPDTKEEAAATVSLLHQIDPETVDSFVSLDSGLLRVGVQVTSTRIMQVPGLLRNWRRLSESACRPVRQSSRPGSTSSSVRPQGRFS
jgi:predicted RND superfamily exporter protein